MEPSPFETVVVRDTTLERHLDKVVEFNDEHKKRLAEIESTINGAVAEVTDSPSDPVSLAAVPDERVVVTDMPKSDDALLDKILMALAALCEEFTHLVKTAEAKFYAPLMLFGQFPNKEEEDEFEAGELEAIMGKSLPLFRDLSHFTERCNNVVLNGIHQLAALFNETSPIYARYQNVHLAPFYRGLGSVLQCLITIDAIIANNHLIGAAWDKYKTMAAIVQDDPARFGQDSVPEDKVYEFAAYIIRLDMVVSGSTFTTCIEQNFDAAAEGGSSVPVRSNRSFLRELKGRIGSRAKTVMQVVGSEYETTESAQIVGLCGLYALYRLLIPPAAEPDKDLFALLWKSQDKLPVVPLYSKVVWRADGFLMRHAAIRTLNTSKLSPRDPAAARGKAVSALDDSFSNTVTRFHVQVCTWLVKLDEAGSESRPAGAPGMSLPEIFQRRAHVLKTGLLLASAIGRILRTYLTLHLATDHPIPKRNLLALAQCVALVKVMEFALRKFEPSFVESAAQVLKDHATALLAIIPGLKMKLSRPAKKSGEAELMGTMLGAVTVAERVLRSTESWSAMRRDYLDLACRIGVRKSHAKDAEMAAVTQTLWSLGMLADWQARLHAACDCIVLYSIREFLPALLQAMAPSPSNSRRLSYVLAAFSDPAAMLGAAVHLSSKDDNLLAAYQTYVFDALHTEVLRPLCVAIENDLRIHVHAMHDRGMTAPNPKSTARPRTFAHLLELPPLRVLQSTLDIRAHVTSYLEKTFYNLTTVALHDWKTYGEMSSLAADKYGLTLTDNHLPMGSLDQGLDVLQIMRNIHVFVARYNYNLNEQLFVERVTVKGNKHFNTVSIRSISGSIRQHGTGMMNTTVNYAYQFLAQKFYLFSEFLYDDHIKSYLARERRWLRKHRKEVDNRYPYDRAASFLKDVRRLGTTPEGLSCLDQFRLLLTQIGNTLGYMRMVRSAGMHHAAEAIQFVPDLKALIKFEDAAAGALDEGAGGGGGDGDGDGDGAGGASGSAASAGAGAGAGGDGGADEDGKASEERRGGPLSEETIQAGKTLDDVLTNLTDNFSSAADYFKLLVNTFKKVMKTTSGEESHLKNFYMIVPSLMLNFVEAYRAAKIRMDKSIKGKEAYFTDDGFAIGVAYILAILKQEKAFESLYWFDSVSRHHRQSVAAIQKEEASIKKAKARKDKERMEQLQYDKRRIASQQHETDALYFAFAGATIFFKDHDEI